MFINKVKNIGLRGIITLLFCVLVSSTVVSLGLSSISLVLVFFVTVLLLGKNKRLVETRKIDVFFLLFFLIATLSLFWSSDIATGLKDVEKKLSFLCLPLLFSSIRQVKIDYKIIFKTFVITVIFFCVIILLNSLIYVIKNGEPLHWVFTKYVRFKLVSISPISFHPPYLALFLNISATILVHFYLLKKVELTNVIALLFFIAVMLYINGSMMGFGCFAVLISIFLCYKMKKKTLMIVISVVVSLSLTTYFIFSKEVRDIVKFDLDPKIDYWETPKYRILRFFDEGDQTRETNWNISKEVIAENLWLGTGVGDFVNELQLRRGEDTYSYVNRLNSHNQYLSIAGKTGLLGLFIFLLILITNLIMAFQYKSYLLATITIIFILTFFTENILDRQWGYITFCFFNYFVYEHIKITQTQIKAGK